LSSSDIYKSNITTEFSCLSRILGRVPDVQARVGYAEGH
jgi:hypothetical protein